MIVSLMRYSESVKRVCTDQKPSLVHGVIPETLIPRKRAIVAVSNYRKIAGK